jgi:hypothetical protein
MVFSGNEEHTITLEEAKGLIEKYQQSEGGEDILAGYYGKTFVLSVLNQEGCVGIRVYNGRKEDGKLEFVIVGVDSDGEDLKDGVMGNRSIPCPPHCGWPWD